MKIAIFDDETFYLESAKNILTKHFTDIDMDIYTLNTNESLDEYLPQIINSTDIIIMDIEMPKINGIRLAEYIREHNKRVRLIFLTNYINYATDVYDTEHTYFVLKKDAEEKLPVALNKAILQLKKNHTATIVVDTLYSGKVILQIEDVLYMERIIRQTVIYTTKGQECTSMKLDKLTELFPSESWAQIHRSYVVNMHHIKKLASNDLTLSNDTVLRISRNHIKQFKEDFMNFIKSLQD